MHVSHPQPPSQECGADLLQRDSVRGNTPLHWAVVHDRKEMVVLLETLWEGVQAQRRARFAATGSTATPPASTHLRLMVPSALQPPPAYTLRDVPLDFQLMSAVNSEGLTPHVLAAQLSRLELFLWLWDRRRIGIWAYVHVRSDLYPLEGVDDVADLLDGTRAGNAGEGSASPSRHAPAGRSSALAARAHVTAVELLTHDSAAGAIMRAGAFQRLLEAKWR